MYTLLFVTACIAYVSTFILALVITGSFLGIE